MTLMVNGKKVVGYALGGTEFYSIGSSDTSVTASGKKWCAVPSKITIKKGTAITYPVSGVDHSGQTGVLESDTQVNCVGANKDHYFFVGFISDPSIYYTFGEDEGYGVGEVLKSECKNIVW